MRIEPNEWINEIRPYVKRSRRIIEALFRSKSMYRIEKYRKISIENDIEEVK